MADAAPKRVKKTLFNSAAGPRSFFDADGSSQIIRPGDEWTGEVLDAEFKTLSPELTTPRAKIEAAATEHSPEPAPAGAPSEAEKAAELADRIANDAEALVKANDEKALRALAEAEKVDVEGDDNKNDLALKIVRKRLGVAEA